MNKIAETQIKELVEIIEHKTYSYDIKSPKNTTEGLKNFIQMAINEIENGNIREALLKLVDLRGDIGCAYVCK